MQQSALDTYTSALERSRKSSSRKKQESTQSVGRGVLGSGVSAVVMGMNHSRKASGMK